MRIKSLSLNKFKKFKINNITELSASLEDQIQIIIGTNGSGKTSFLRELFPYAPNKDLFGNEGGKELKIEKENSEYIIGFSKNGNKKIHFFKCNGEELNPTSSFNVQNELIEKYLINPVLKDILTCSINLCRMIPSQRKQLILNLNPIDISPILDSHKNIRSYLGKIKNNLSMLYDRKTRLTQTKVSEEESKLIKTNKLNLEEEERNLLTEVIKVSTALNDLRSNNETLLSSNVDTGEAFFKKVEDYLKRAYLELDKFYSLDSTETHYKIQYFSSSIDVLKETNNKLTNEIEELIKELEQKEELLSLSSKQSNICDIEKNIHDLIEERDRINKIRIDTKVTFTEFEITQYKNNKDKIIILLNRFIDIFSKPIYTSEIINRIRRKIDKIESDINLNRSRIKDESNRRDILIKELDSIKKNNEELRIPSSCEKNNCSLYADISRKETQILSKMNDANKSIDSLSTKLKKQNKVGLILDSMYKTQLSYHPILKEIKAIFTSIPVFNLIIPKEELLWYLNTNPFGIVGELDRVLNSSEDHYYKIKLDAKIDEFKKEYLSIKKSSETSSELIIKLIDEIKAKIERIKDNFLNNEKNIKENESKKFLYQEFNEMLDSANRISALIDHTYHYTSVSRSIEYYEAYLSILQGKLENTRKTLFNISEKIKEQEYIEVRLKEEILSPIKGLEEKKKDYEIIELALQKLTSEYTENFIGNIIKNMNFFINKIFTYPMEIQPVDGLSDMSFRFLVDVNDIEVDDISELSEGQKSIVNLSFCLALILELDLQNNPFYVDEVDSALDTTHQRRLIDLFLFLIENNIVSQLFSTFHSSVISEGLNSSIIVLDETNVILPEKYNENVIIKK